MFIKGIIFFITILFGFLDMIDYLNNFLCIILSFDNSCYAYKPSIPCVLISPVLLCKNRSISSYEVYYFNLKEDPIF